MKRNPAEIDSLPSDDYPVGSINQSPLRKAQRTRAEAIITMNAIERKYLDHLRSKFHSWQNTAIEIEADALMGTQSGLLCKELETLKQAALQLQEAIAGAGKD